MPVKFINHIIETKGMLHSIERGAQILMRYSFGKRRFADIMASVGNGHGKGKLRVTFCITANLLNSHREFIENSLNGSGHEYAAHGYHHCNMKKKNRAEQSEILKKSYELFKNYGLEVNGFRCPYLSYNSNTLKAFASGPFSWVSNNIIFWENNFSATRRSQSHLRKLGLLYRSWNSVEYMSVPSYAGRVLDIPITAPDDEMLYERFRVKQYPEISAVWRRILKKVHRRGELFHLLFHPERFLYVGKAIKEVVQDADNLDQPVWFATLNEISEWWKKRRKSSWSIESTGQKRLLLRTAPEATVLVKSRGYMGKGFYKSYMPAVEALPGSGFYALDSPVPEEHIIRIPGNAPQTLEEFLVNEGFLVKRGGFNDGSLCIDGYESFKKADGLPLLSTIDEAPFPLVRVWRWPNGARSAFTVSSDVDSINIGDYLIRFVTF